MDGAGWRRPFADSGDETVKGYHLDPDSELAAEHFAVVYAPRRNRDRFPEMSVRLVASESEARELADEAGKQYAARVIGPARSSEGVKVFYLVSWLPG